MTSYEDLITAAVKKEMSVVGADIAVQEANAVTGLEVDAEGDIVMMDREGKAVLTDLVDQYIDLGGPVSAMFIVRAIEDMDLTVIDLPATLQERL